MQRTLLPFIFGLMIACLCAYLLLQAYIYPDFVGTIDYREGMRPGQGVEFFVPLATGLTFLLGVITGLILLGRSGAPAVSSRVRRVKMMLILFYVLSPIILFAVHETSGTESWFMLGLSGYYIVHIFITWSFCGTWGLFKRVLFFLYQSIIGALATWLTFVAAGLAMFDGALS